MTKTPHRRNEGAGQAQRQADNRIIAPASTCPNSDECNRWKELPGESAECRTCWQTFDRPTMAAIFAGRA